MLKLRAYREEDAATVLSWANNEQVFYQWSAGLFGPYPITPETLHAKLKKEMDAKNWFVYVCYEDKDENDDVKNKEENTLIGFFVLRYPEASKDIIRFAYILLNDQLRGQGYGKELVRVGLKEIKDNLGGTRVTLIVFENNPIAFHCYQSIGFKETGKRETYPVKDEDWICTEMDYYL